jgi:hypothetical protein
MTAQDIAGRQKANPGLHTAGEAAGLIGGALTGEGLVSGAAEAAAHFVPEVASKFGSAFLKNAVMSGVIQGSDEVSKSLLGQGDPETPIAGHIVNIGGAALVGGLTGGIFNMVGGSASNALEAAENSRMGQKAKSAMIGLGLAAKANQMGAPVDPEIITNMLRSQGAGTSVTYDMVKSGIKAYNGLLKATTGTIAHGIEKAAGVVAGGVAGSVLGGPTSTILGGMAGTAVSDALAPTIDKIAGGTLNKVSGAIGSTILKAAAEGETDQMGTLVNYAKSAAKGNKTINKSLDYLFLPGQEAFDSWSSDDNQNKKLKKFVEEGGVNQQIENHKFIRSSVSRTKYYVEYS